MFFFCYFIFCYYFLFLVIYCGPLYFSNDIPITSKSTAIYLFFCGQYSTANSSSSSSLQFFASNYMSYGNLSDFTVIISSDFFKINYKQTGYSINSFNNFLLWEYVFFYYSTYFIASFKN